MYFSKLVQKQYLDKYGYGEMIPVAANDVAFSVHAVLITAITMFQVVIYEALGTGFTPFAEPVFRRCINIIQTQQFAKVDPVAAGVQYDKEFIVCFLDLFSGLVKGLGSGIESLIILLGNFLRMQGKRQGVFLTMVMFLLLLGELGTGLYLRWFIYGKPDVPKASPETASEVYLELAELQRNKQWDAAVRLVVEAGDPKAQF